MRPGAVRHAGYGAPHPPALADAERQPLVRERERPNARPGYRRRDHSPSGHVPATNFLQARCHVRGVEDASAAGGRLSEAATSVAECNGHASVAAGIPCENRRSEPAEPRWNMRCSRPARRGTVARPWRHQRMHILITGGAGFIGSHLADELLAHGYDVRALDNL